MAHRKIQAMASRYRLKLGDSPLFGMDPAVEDAWWGRDPFSPQELPGVTPDLLPDPRGTTDGHNTLQDSNMLDGLRVDPLVPIAPLFVRDLAGRVIYTGFGPDTKTNRDWAAYTPQPQHCRTGLQPVCAALHLPPLLPRRTENARRRIA
jgi:hypothetical protein